MSKLNEYIEMTQKKVKHPKQDGSELPIGGRAPKNDNSTNSKEEEFLNKICHDIEYAIRYESPYDDAKKAFNKIVKFYRENYF